MLLLQISAMAMVVAMNGAVTIISAASLPCPSAGQRSMCQQGIHPNMWTKSTPERVFLYTQNSKGEDMVAEGSHSQ